MKNASNKIVGFFKTAFFRSGYFWAVVSGALTSLTLYNKYLFFLTWISIIPLCYFLIKHNDSIRRCFLLVFLWGLTYYTLLYTWFWSLHPLEFMGFSNQQSLIGVMTIWLSISIAQTLQMSIMGLIYGLIKPKGIWAVFVLGALWVVLEWAQGYGIFAMNWGRLALSQYFFLPNIQSASLFGSLFISFLIICVNGLIALYIRLRLTDKISNKALYIAASAILIVNMTFGLIRMAVVNTKIKDNQTVNIATIQTNYPSEIKWQASQSEVFDAYYDLTLTAVEQGAQVIIWPETTVTVSLEGTSYYEKLSSLSADKNVYIFVGGYHEDEDLRLYNSILGFYPDEAQNTVYNKRQLVPFGEFLPYEDFLNRFEALEQLNLSEDAVTKGEKSVVFKTEHGSFSGLICFDSLFQRFSYESVRDGAQVLFVATNDSWYIKSQSIYQHFGHAVLRAVENNRFLVRSANAGVSGVISSTGKTIKNIPTYTADYILEKIPLINQKTLYTITGDLIAYIALIGVTISFVYFRFLHGKEILKKIRQKVKSNQTKKQL